MLIITIILIRPKIDYIFHYLMLDITKQLNNFQLYVYLSLFKIIAVTETWLCYLIYDNEVLSHDFVLFRNDRTSRGGGVLLCVHSSISSQLVLSHNLI